MSDSVIQDVICGIGFPVHGNPTQFLMERSFAAAGLDTRFMTFEVVPEKMADALGGMKAMTVKFHENKDLVFSAENLDSIII